MHRSWAVLAVPVIALAGCSASAAGDAVDGSSPLVPLLTLAEPAHMHGLPSCDLDDLFGIHPAERAPRDPFAGWVGVDVLDEVDALCADTFILDGGTRGSVAILPRSAEAMAAIAAAVEAEGMPVYLDAEGEWTTGPNSQPHLATSGLFMPDGAMALGHRASELMMVATSVRWGD
ncbi:hypothetical protein [Agrococcus sp. BE272]|uniref:hypothetical protein n=1 Tax=Agrococcus sp. BE272 TaxID=2817727 RepID=UPI00285A59E8|nr:hypothetical protein [Agrococcus sp. BE272]MDR7233151.1 hypothetical protein [Agrococcus sp. BE272]